jgi:hypothetical protein
VCSLEVPSGSGQWKALHIAANDQPLQKSVAFPYANNGQTEKEYRKTILFTIASK